MGYSSEQALIVISLVIVSDDRQVLEQKADVIFGRLFKRLTNIDVKVTKIRIFFDSRIRCLLGVVQSRLGRGAGVLLTNGKEDWRLNMFCRASWLIESQVGHQAGCGNVVFVFGSKGLGAGIRVGSVEECHWFIGSEDPQKGMKQLTCAS